ncbi:MAG: glycosyltransferase family 4 protein [Ilumatobacter sp.]|nr:glycosyltransferase family 4 protein [Ilumatobacter sp.]
MSSPRILLTISGSIPELLDEDVAAGLRPRTDYRVMAERLAADVVDVEQALAQTGRLGRLVQRLAGNGALVGWCAFRLRNEYDVVATDGEHVGVPWEVLTRVFGRRGARHVMIAHVLSAPKKAAVMRWTRLAARVDAYIVYCRHQADFLRDELGVPAARIVESAFMVDTEYFDPARSDVPRRRMICSAGLERRDYPTLIKAVDGLDVEVVITASSAWSRRADSSAGEQLPDNVTVTRLDMPDFRDMYAAAAFVVMPLERVEFQAGITTILEAMSMGRAVVCTRVPGQTDSVIDGETAVLVPPGDPDALRSAIERLLADPDDADRMGRNGQAWVLEHARIEQYADEVGAAIAGVLAA